MNKVSIHFFDDQLNKSVFSKKFYLTRFFAISIFGRSEPRKPLNNAQMSGVFLFLGES